MDHATIVPICHNDELGYGTFMAKFCRHHAHYANSCAYIKEMRLSEGAVCLCALCWICGCEDMIRWKGRVRTPVEFGNSCKYPSGNASNFYGRVVAFGDDGPPHVPTQHGAANRGSECAEGCSL
jgi:hypothetical protein